MQNRRQKKRCAYSIRLFCLLACGILLTACGERCVDDDATVIGSVEEEESDQKSESGQENLEGSEESEQPKPDAADKDEEPQETGEVIGGKPKEGTDLAQDNEERFYECVEMLKVNRTEAETRYQRLCRDDVFRNQTAQLVGVDIEDLDQNGQPDMAPMDFPYETADDSYNPDWRGVRITITQEAQADTYSAYCAYLDDTIVFESENVREPEGRQKCGGNSRGYFNLWRGEYEGRDALEVSEILSGEGGTGHVLGLAKFLIVWDEDGEGKIVKWWVEPS